ncbi:MAG: DUF6089 family protein [Bacteroidetes bacterium]|nr:DUF6089 family protein [Bacteroidota bacterium]
MVKQLLLFSLLFFLSVFSVYGQREEVGVFIGGANYQGDLAPDIVLKESHLAIGINYKKNLNPYFSYSVNFNYANISGDDNNNQYLKPRNLSFSTEIIEISPRIEFNFYKYGVGLHPRKFTPYVFTGLSGFSYNPTTKMNGETIKLRKLATEGQGVLDKSPKVYGKYGLAIPLGGGLRFHLAEKWNLYAHCEYMATFTDYLDDVSGVYADKDKLNDVLGNNSVRLSDRTGEKTNKYLGTTGKQRGNPQKYDWYIFSGITISYSIPNLICFEF